MEVWRCGDLGGAVTVWCAIACVMQRVTDRVSRSCVAWTCHNTCGMSGTCRHVSARAVLMCGACQACVSHTPGTCTFTHNRHVHARVRHAPDGLVEYTHMHVGVSNLSRGFADAVGCHPVLIRSTRRSAVRADVTGMEVYDWLKRSCKESARE